MKSFYLLLILLFTGCGSTNSTVENRSFIDYLKTRAYTFSDSRFRNLRIVFLNDSLIKINNHVTTFQGVIDGDVGDEGFYFTDTYQFKQIDFYRYVIERSIKNSPPPSTARYIHPYRNERFHNRADVFPNVVNDTLFFNEDWTKILIKDFCFELKKK